MADLINFTNIKNNQLNPSSATLSGVAELACTMLTVGTSLSAKLSAEKYTVSGHDSWIQDRCSTFNIANYIANGSIAFNSGDQGTHKCSGGWVFVIGSNKYDTYSFSASAPIDNPILMHEITKKGDYGIAKMEFSLSKNVTSEATYNTHFKNKYITAKGWKLSDNLWTPVAFVMGERILNMGGWTREGTPASQMTYGGLPLLSWLGFEGDAAVYSQLTKAMEDLLNHKGEKITPASACVMYPGTVRTKGTGWSSWDRVYQPQFIY